MPVLVNYGGNYSYLSEFGVTEKKGDAIRIDEKEIEEIVYRAGKFSVYSVEDQLKRGFLTAEYGERIGIAGEWVFQNGSPITLRNISSLCIRVPHEIQDCGEEIYDCCFKDGIVNILICSSPGIGKTTILRDIAKKISENTRLNLLICDERGEISSLYENGNWDALLFADKQTAFTSGIRALRPDVLVTDELSLEDCKAVEKAVRSGVKVIASAHFINEKAIQSPFLGLFDYYVFLDRREIGRINGIYDAHLKKVCLT